MLNFFVERCSLFARRHRDINDLGSLCDPADFFEIVVVLLTGGSQFNAVAGNVQAVSVSKNLDRAIWIGDHFTWFDFARFVNRNFDCGELKIRKSLNRFFELHVGPAFR